ncbi:MAG: hypothetical protein JWN04_6596 [Myxococcaceae bacterium]|nr:hypothetical protein [Myxococcaceae bacterium]
MARHSSASVVVAHARAAIFKLALLVCHAALQTACNESLLLGSACPPGHDTCAPTAPGGEVAIPVPGLETVPNQVISFFDGGIDGGLPAILIADALDAGPVPKLIPLELQNQSFERQGGIGGDVVLSNTVSVLVPIPPVDTVFAELPHWFACVPLSVSSLTWQQDGKASVKLSMFGDYLSFVINGTTVRQGLDTPLLPGATYSLQAQVRSSEPIAGLHLQVRGAMTSCGPGYVLGRSPSVPPSDTWLRTCVTFSADQPYGYLLLAPSVDGAAPPDSARFYLDELHQVASCPGT